MLFKNLAFFAMGFAIIVLVILSISHYRTNLAIQEFEDVKVTLDNKPVDFPSFVTFSDNTEHIMSFEIDGEKYIGKMLAVAFTANKYIRVYNDGKIVYELSEKSGNLNSWHRYFPIVLSGKISIEIGFNSNGGIEKKFYIGTPDDVIRFIERANVIESSMFYLGTGFMIAFLVVGLFLYYGLKDKAFLYGSWPVFLPTLTAIDEMNLFLVPILLWKKIAILGAALSMFLTFFFIKELFKQKVKLFEKLYAVIYWIVFIPVLLSPSLSSLRRNYSNF
ncbi:MAG: hypothetical protein ACPL3B_01065 [Fervidobacterium sp.]|jgi:methyl-accepting chemotaxis protein